MHRLIHTYIYVASYAPSYTYSVVYIVLICNGIQRYAIMCVCVCACVCIQRYTRSWTACVIQHARRSAQRQLKQEARAHTPPCITMYALHTARHKSEPARRTYSSSRYAPSHPSSSASAMRARYDSTARQAVSRPAIQTQPKPPRSSVVAA